MRLSAIALAAFVAGCAVGPDYQRPTTPVPASYKEAPEGWKVAQLADQTDRGDWWAVLQQRRAPERSRTTTEQRESDHRAIRGGVSAGARDVFPERQYIGVGFAFGDRREQPFDQQFQLRTARLGEQSSVARCHLGGGFVG